MAGSEALTLVACGVCRERKPLKDSVVVAGQILCQECSDAGIVWAAKQARAEVFPSKVDRFATFDGHAKLDVGDDGLDRQELRAACRVVLAILQVRDGDLRRAGQLGEGEANSVTEWFARCVAKLEKEA